MHNSGRTSTPGTFPLPPSLCPSIHPEPEPQPAPEPGPDPSSNPERRTEVRAGLGNRSHGLLQVPCPLGPIPPVHPAKINRHRSRRQIDLQLANVADARAPAVAAAVPRPKGTHATPRRIASHDMTLHGVPHAETIRRSRRRRRRNRLHERHCGMIERKNSRRALTSPCRTSPPPPG